MPAKDIEIDRPLLECTQARGLDHPSIGISAKRRIENIAGLSVVVLCELNVHLNALSVCRAIVARYMTQVAADGVDFINENRCKMPPEQPETCCAHDEDETEPRRRRTGTPWLPAMSTREKGFARARRLTSNVLVEL